MENTRINPHLRQGAVIGSSCKIGDIVKDKEGNLYKILSFSNSLFLMLKDLKTNELVISSAEYYYP